MTSSGQSHAPANLPVAKKFGTNWIGNCVGARDGLHGFDEEIISRYKTNAQIAKELKITPILDKLLEYKRSWI